jgi:type II secretory pathway component GspD/PulD (secretin)
MKQIIMRLVRIVLCVCFADITANASPATNGEATHILIEAAVLTGTKTSIASSSPQTGSRTVVSSNLYLGGVVCWFTNVFPVIGQQNGIQYVAKFRDELDLTLAALVNDQPMQVIQRLRIVTSENIPAQFVVGESVPYIAGGYSALWAGLEFLELDITPRFASDGLMVINIRTNLPNVGDVPIPTSTINEISVTVREGEIFMVAVALDPPPERTSTIRKSIHYLHALLGRSRIKPVKDEMIVLFRAKRVPIGSRDSLGRPIFTE